MKPKYRKAVFIVVYSISKGKPSYLLLKRKWHWSGWEFPKGGMEKGEKLFNSVKREVHEETGLIPKGKIKRYAVSEKYRFKKKLADRPGYLGQSWKLFSVNVKRKKVKIDKKEHSAYKWLAFDEAYKKLKWPNQKRCLKIVDNNLEGK